MNARSCSVCSKALARDEEPEGICSGCLREGEVHAKPSVEPPRPQMRNESSITSRPAESWEDLKRRVSPRFSKDKR